MTEMLRNTPQTLGYVPLDAPHILACPRHPVEKLWRILPTKYLKALEDNEKIAECCRNPRANMDIEAWWSNEEEKNKGAPDIYKFYCNECERVHVRFCLGGDHPDSKNYSKFERPDLYDLRPFWEVR